MPFWRSPKLDSIKKKMFSNFFVGNSPKEVVNYVTMLTFLWYKSSSVLSQNVILLLEIRLRHMCVIDMVKMMQFASVLTRILPWGVPGPPLLRNRVPVRTLGGQLLQMVCYMKYLLDPIW